MFLIQAKTRDFLPKLKLEEETIEVVEKMKLLGVQVTSDLKWSANTAYIVRRGYNKLWTLRRLKSTGANSEELVDIYSKHVRSILEYAVVVWHSALTIENSADIKRVQKSALAIILGKSYSNYENALVTLNLQRLSERIASLCLKFAENALKPEKHSSWFVPDQNNQNTRKIVQRTKNVQARTQRFKKISHPIPDSDSQQPVNMKHPSVNVSCGE